MFSGDKKVFFLIFFMFCLSMFQPNKCYILLLMHPFWSNCSHVYLL